MKFLVLNLYVFLGILGFAEAVKVANEGGSKSLDRIRALSKSFLDALQKNLGEDTVMLNGPPLEATKRLSNNLSLQFRGIDGGAMLKVRL